MPAKLTMWFNVPDGGFSEIWYWSGTVTFPLVGVTPFSELYRLRAKMCGRQTKTIGYKVSDLANPRLAHIDLDYHPTVMASGSDTPSNSWLAIAKGQNNLAFRQLWLRGIADTSIIWNDDPGYFDYSAAFLSAYSAYKTALISGSNQWCIRHVESKKQQAAVAASVTGVAAVAGLANTRLTAITTLLGTETIIVGGFKKPLSALNGTYLPGSGYQLGTGGIDILRKGFPVYALAGYPGGGHFRPQAVDLVPVREVTIEFARSRQIGRSFFQLHGRR